MTRAARLRWVSAIAAGLCPRGRWSGSAHGQAARWLHACWNKPKVQLKANFLIASVFSDTRGR